MLPCHRFSVFFLLRLGVDSCFFPPSRPLPSSGGPSPPTPPLSTSWPPVPPSCLTSHPDAPLPLVNRISLQFLNKLLGPAPPPLFRGLKLRFACFPHPRECFSQAAPEFLIHRTPSKGTFPFPIGIPSEPKPGPSPHTLTCRSFPPVSDQPVPSVVPSNPRHHTTQEPLLECVFLRFFFGCLEFVMSMTSDIQFCPSFSECVYSGFMGRALFLGVVLARGPLAFFSVTFFSMVVGVLSLLVSTFFFFVVSSSPYMTFFTISRLFGHKPWRTFFRLLAALLKVDFGGRPLFFLFSDCYPQVLSFLFVRRL